MVKYLSELTGSLLFRDLDNNLVSRVDPGPDAVNVTGSLHITGSRLTLNGSDLELRISTLEQSAIGDINIGGLLSWSGSTNTWTSSINDKTSSFITTSSFNDLTQSVNNLTNQTGSYIISGSISGSNLQLHTVSGSIYNIQLTTVDSTLPGGTISSSLQITELGFITGSPIISSSLSGSSLVFTDYNNTSSIIDLSGITTNVDTGSFVTTSSFNNFTGSLVSTSSFNSLTSSFVTTSSLNSITGSFVTTSSLNSITSSFVTTSSFNTLTSSVDLITEKTGSFVVSGSILSGSALILHKEDGTTLGLDLPSAGSGSYNGLTSSINRLTSQTGSYLDSGSISGSNLILHKVSGEIFTLPLPDSINTGSFITTSSFNTFTSSIITTSSFNTFTSSFVTTSSLNSITSSFITTSSFYTITGSVNSLNSITGSLVNSGSISGSILKLHTVSGSVFEINLPQGGGTGSVDTGSFVTTSSFNTFTGSVDNLTSQTGSYLNSGSKTGTVLSLYQQGGGRFDFDLGSSDTTFNGNRVVSNQLLPSLYSASFNAGTTGSIQEFLEAIFFPNLPPDFTLTPTGLDTTNAITGSKIAEVVVTDGDSSTPYEFNISGPDSNLFYTVPQNSISSSWFVYVTGSITDNISGSFTNGILNEQIFDLTGSAIDQFNGITTKPIELEVTQPVDQGYVYLYQTDTSRGGTSYNLYMGIESESADTPPSASLYNTYTTALTAFNSGALGEAVVGPVYGGTTNVHRIGTVRSGSNLQTMLQPTYTTPNRTGHFLLVASSGSALTGLPTSMTDSFGGSTAGEYVQSLDFGNGFGNEGTIVHEISLQTPHLGYTDWFVIGNLSAGGGTSIKYRLTPSSGSQPTS